MKMGSRTGFGVISKAVMVDPDLSTGAKVLYALLAAYAKQGNRECWVSRKTLAADLGIGKSSLDRWLRELTDKGVAVREGRVREDGSQASSITRLLDFVAVYDPDLPDAHEGSADLSGEGVHG